MEAYCLIESHDLTVTSVWYKPSGGLTLAHRDSRVKLASAALGLSISYLHNLCKLPRHVMHAIHVERPRLK